MLISLSESFSIMQSDSDMNEPQSDTKDLLSDSDESLDMYIVFCSILNGKSV